MLQQHSFIQHLRTYRDLPVPNNRLHNHIANWITNLQMLHYHQLVRLQNSLLLLNRYQNAHHIKLLVQISITRNLTQPNKIVRTIRNLRHVPHLHNRRIGNEFQYKFRVLVRSHPLLTLLLQSSPSDSVNATDFNVRVVRFGLLSEQNAIDHKTHTINELYAQHLYLLPLLRSELAISFVYHSHQQLPSIQTLVEILDLLKTLHIQIFHLTRSSLINLVFA